MAFLEFGLRKDFAPILTQCSINLLWVSEQLPFVLEGVDARLRAWEQIIEPALIPCPSRREVRCTFRQTFLGPLLLQRLSLSRFMNSLEDEAK